jgi:hypothetical protein
VIDTIQFIAGYVVAQLHTPKKINTDSHEEAKHDRNPKTANP